MAVCSVEHSAPWPGAAGEHQSSLLDEASEDQGKFAQS
jgi:hypothetical protein